MSGKGWILYHRPEEQLDPENKSHYGVIRILDAGRKLGLDLQVVIPSQFDLVVSHEDRTSIILNGVTNSLPNFVLARTGSATTYFASAILRQLQSLGVSCINTAEAIDCVKDKLRATQMLAQSHLPTPKTMLVQYPTDAKVVEKEIGFPAVVKNISGSGGKGVYLCESAAHFTDLMDLVFGSGSHPVLVVQEFIQSSYGRDIRVLVVGGKAIGCMERRAVQGFKSNIAAGGEAHPYPMEEKMAWMATEATRLLGLDISGVDLLFREDGSYAICECNSSPDFFGLEKVTGQIIAEKMLEYIKIHCGLL